MKPLAFFAHAIAVVAAGALLALALLATGTTPEQLERAADWLDKRVRKEAA
jgi:hypothetical protein